MGECINGTWSLCAGVDSCSLGYFAWSKFRLVWLQKDQLQNISPKPFYWAILPMFLSAMLWLLGDFSGINLFKHAAFTGLLMSLVSLFLGIRFTRIFWFPILFLAFMVPVGAELVPVLQRITADASVWMLRASGVPTFIEGMMVQMPHSLFEIAEACAGIRFLIANVMIAVLFAHLAYTHLWKKILFIFIGIAIPIGANCIRAYGIMMIAHKTNTLPGFAPLPIIPDAHKPADRKAYILPVAMACLIIVTAPLMAKATLPTSGSSAANNLPSEIAEGWSISQIDPETYDHWHPEFVGADKTYRLDLVKNDEKVHVFVAYYTHQRDGHEVTLYSNRFDDKEIWRRGALGGVALENAPKAGLPQHARHDLITRAYGNINGLSAKFQRRMIASWYWVNGEFTSDKKTAKLEQVKSRLTGENKAAAVLALSAEWDQQRSEAEIILNNFLADSKNMQSVMETLKN